MAARGHDGIFVDDFSGGVNYVESPYTLPAPYLPPGGLNVTLRGRHLVARFGTRLAGSLGAASQYIFYSHRINRLFSQEGTGVYSYTVSSANQALGSRTLIGSFTTSAKCGIVEWGANLVLVHPIDGVFFWNGSTFTNVSAVAKGRCIAAWQNKVWVSGDDTNTSRIWWSALGNPSSWTTATDFVDLREPDDSSITALGVGNGIDIVGRGALLVFKVNSTHKIISSSTGQFVTLDGHRGAAGSEAVTTVNGRTYFCNRNGVYMLNGDEVTTISDPIRPAWDFGVSTSGVFTAASAWDRAYFCHTVGASAGYRKFWEFIPERNAWFAHGLHLTSTTFDSYISATRGAQSDSGAQLNTSLVLSTDGTSVLVLPHQPSGGSSSAGTPPVLKDFWNGSTGNNVVCRFPLPVVHAKLERFAIRDMRVLGWGDGVTDGCRMMWAGLGESPDPDPAAFSDFTLRGIQSQLGNLPTYVPVPTGVYSILRPYIEATPTALQTPSTGQVWAPGNSTPSLPSMAVEAVQLRYVRQS